MTLKDIFAMALVHGASFGADEFGDDNYCDKNYEYGDNNYDDNNYVGVAGALVMDEEKYCHQVLHISLGTVIDEKLLSGSAGFPPPAPPSASLQSSV